MEHQNSITAGSFSHNFDSLFYQGANKVLNHHVVVAEAQKQ